MGGGWSRVGWNARKSGFGGCLADAVPLTWNGADSYDTTDNVTIPSTDWTLSFRFGKDSVTNQVICGNSHATNFYMNAAGTAINIFVTGEQLSWATESPSDGVIRSYRFEHTVATKTIELFLDDVSQGSDTYTTLTTGPMAFRVGNGISLDFPLLSGSVLTDLNVFGVHKWTLSQPNSLVDQIGSNDLT